MPNVTDLRAHTVDAATHRSTWDTEARYNGDWSYWESFRHTDETGATWTLVAAENVVGGLYIEADDRVYEQHEYDRYAEGRYTEDNLTDLRAWAGESWDALFAVEVPDSVEGPMMSSWYACSIEDPIKAAALIIDLPLCVVEVDGAYGLALTGGGMDLSWEICAAFIALGFLPPYNYADLPGMAGRGRSESDKLIIAACLQTMQVTADRAMSNHTRLTERAERWAVDQT